MARIFYHTDTGNIYGVHGDDFTGGLPAGVAFIDVAGPPDAIAWPTNSAGDSSEGSARVSGGVLVVRDRPDLDALDQAIVDRLLLDSGVMKALAQALFQVVNDVRVLKGDGTITPAQFKAFLKGLMR